MKLHSLIPSLVLGAAVAASAQTVAPRQTPVAKAKTKIEGNVSGPALPEAAENGVLHNLRLNPGTLAQVVEQLQVACLKAAEEQGWTREAAVEILRRAKPLVQQAQVKGDEELESASQEVSKAQALATEAKAAVKGREATVRAEADFEQADRTYQRLLSATKQNPNVIPQQELDDAKAKRDTANRVLMAIGEDKAQKETAEANLSKAQALLAQARARVGAERDAAGAELFKALDFFKNQMPALTYGPGTSEAKVSAALDLVDARPVDALALIAAAAGCDLTPIYAPPQEGDEAGTRIIGYCFELPRRRASLSAPLTSYTGYTALDPNTGSGTGAGSGSTSLNPLYADVTPKATPGTSTYFDAFSAQPTPSISDWVSASPVPASPPAPGTTAPNELRVPVPKPFPQAAPPMPSPRGSSGGGSRNSAPASYVFDATTGQVLGGANYSTVFVPSTIDLDAQVVRIYAVGPVLESDGPAGERERIAMIEHQKAFQEVIQQALELAEASGPPEPKLYFHERSGVLIARATLRQQGIIEQAVAAMKENDRFVNASRGNAVPQTNSPKP